MSLRLITYAVPHVLHPLAELHNFILSNSPLRSLDKNTDKCNRNYKDIDPQITISAQAL